MQNYYLPDFFSFFNLNMTVQNFVREYPEKCTDHIKINSWYGTFPGAIWNSGRVYLGSADHSNIKNTLAEMNRQGIPARFTWTSSILEEKDLYDSYCNLIMHEAVEAGEIFGIRNECLVNSELLEDYIKKNYPSMRILSSTTKCLNKSSFLKELKDYDLAVMDFHYNRTKEIYRQIIKQGYQGKVELLINCYCPTACSFKRRKDHYTYLANCQKRFENPEHFCDLVRQDFSECLKLELTLHPEDIRQLEKVGFRHFKIEGRTVHPIDVVESYIYYLIKPEYQMEARKLFLLASI